MQVFKTFMKIVSTKKNILITYLVIFLAISVGMVKAVTNGDSMYTSESLNICIEDMDNSQASKALTDYLKKLHKVSIITDTDNDHILDELYYRRTDYVLTIKKGYADRLAKSEKNNLFENKAVPGVYNASLIDSQLNNYVNVVSAYIRSGSNLEKALEQAVSALDQRVNVKINTFSDYNGKGYKIGVYYYMQYLPYIFISLLISMLCPAIYAMMKKDIHRRSICSAVSSSKQTFQIMLGVGIVSVGIWVIFTIACGFLYGFDFLNYKGMYAVLNSFVFMLVSLGITLVIAMLGAKDQIVSLAANVVGLGMSFLCGVFVPQSMLGDNLTSASKFLPAYWYIKANDMLADKSNEIYSSGKILSYIGVEFLFAIALFSAALLISKHKARYQ